MSKTRKLFVVIISVFIALTLCFIFGNSFQTQQESVQNSGGIYDRVSHIFDAIFGAGVITHSIFRTLAHFSEFFVLGIEVALLFFVASPKKSVSKLITFLTGLIVAIIDESLQFLNDRGPEVTDVLIDYLGYLSAVCFIILIIIIVKRIHNKKSV